MLQDILYALRTFRNHPGFTAAAVLSLAIGIGANTAIFSVANGLFLRPLPYKDPERVVVLWNRSPGLNITQDWFSTAQYFDIKRGHSGFDDVAIAIGSLYNLTGDGDPDRVTVVRASSNLLPMYGATPAQGRLLRPEEDTPGRTGTAILSHALWTRRYGGDPKVLGKTIILNGLPYEVVGILPRSFTLPHEVLPTLYGGDQAEIIVPLPLAASAANDRDHEDYNVIGRLKPGVTVTQAQSEMDTLTARLRRDHPEVYPPNGGLTFGIVPLLEQVVGDVRLPLRLLLGSVAFVLLIACANVANLLLSRALARQKEIAVRAAMGASRNRIASQLLVESITLALCGALLGVALAAVGLKCVQALGPRSVPRISELGMDWRVLLFTLAVSVLSGVLFGFAPAWRLSRTDLQSALKETGKGSSGAGAMWGRGHNLRRLLVVSELALSVVLLIGAGLLIRSFARLQNVSPGFNPKNVLTFELAMTGNKYADATARINTYRDLLQRLEHLPGATASGAITALPFSTVWAWGPITVEGRPPQPGEKFINCDIRTVAGHYFQAMGIPLIRGRFFDEHDTADKPRVIIVDEFMAREMWPGQDPIGKRIHYGGIDDSKAPWQTVIGVVGRVKQYTLESDSRIALYMPHTQQPSRAMTVLVQSSADPVALGTVVKQQVHELDANMPVYGVQTMEHRVADSLGRRRFTMLLLGVFAALAFILAAIGTYSVMSYLVSQGEREIGIRIALGATQSRILRLVVGQGAAVIGAGVGFGLTAALVLSRLLKALLFGVTANDPPTFTVVTVLLIVVALAASYFPARRASRVDPMISLRSE